MQIELVIPSGKNREEKVKRFAESLIKSKDFSQSIKQLKETLQE